MVTVMIVDDNRGLHTVLEQLLVLLGHSVVEHAYDGQEAIDKLALMEHRPDVILMNEHMPFMNGTAATREIKQKGIPVNIILFSADESIRQEAMDAGACAFLRKPVPSEVLISTIEESVIQE